MPFHREKMQDFEVSWGGIVGKGLVMFGKG